MGVQYSVFNDIDIAEFDAVVVGTGFAGAVTARELAERGGKKVLVIEKRGHIGGNMYDELDDAGILVHRYGPHIFHTNDKRAFDYVRRFTEWRDYQHEVLADWYGTYMPVPFNKNSMEIAFGEERASQLIEKLIATFGDERKVTITELRAQDDPELSEIADFVYKNVFLYYTQKQWGLTPEEVDPSVTARVPVFISRDNPLAGKKKVTMDDLKPFPFIQYEQGEEGSFFFAEEAVWPEYSPKQINVTDRATILNFIIGLNGYTVCTGIDNGDLNNEKIVTVPLDTDETMLVGWITNERAKLSKAAETYLEKLKSVVASHGYTLID